MGVPFGLLVSVLVSTRFTRTEIRVLCGKEDFRAAFSASSARTARCCLARHLLESLP